MRPADRKRGPKVMEQDIDFDASIDDDEPTTEELVEMLRELDEIRAENEAAG
ncbi:MAG: hypothetical protein OXT68_04695 [Chloroflexota bacterium]|nr:hypothetical protein [Chloroflexota bacterium]MDE2950045.1 hypothetical protein [Chloroflexota bacterium]